MAQKTFEALRNLEASKRKNFIDIASVLRDCIGAQTWKDRKGFWQILSACATDFTQDVYSKIYNFNKNIVDIDICEIKALKSMARETGLSHLTDFIKDIYPEDFNKLINLFSVNYKLLYQNNQYLSNAATLDFVRNNRC